MIKTTIKTIINPILKPTLFAINSLLLNGRKEYIRSNENPLVSEGVHILNKDLSIEFLINNKINLARFGDGEFNLIRKTFDTGFQSRNDVLSDRLKDVLKSNIANLKIAIPYSLINIDENSLESSTFWFKYVVANSKYLTTILSIDKEYIDASLTRLYIPIMNQHLALKRFADIKKIWDNKDILFVEGKSSRNGIGNDLFDNAKSIYRIICPAKNAFDKYDEILNAIKKHGKDKLVIGCLGPTASILAFDLANTDIWFLDLGHIDIEYMWCLNNKGRTLIKGRLINELKSKNQDLGIDDITLERYTREILKTID